MANDLTLQWIWVITTIFANINDSIRGFYFYKDIWVVLTVNSIALLAIYLIISENKKIKKQKVL